MTIFHLFPWLYHTATQIEGSPIGQMIRESSWLFPAIEVVHLLALAMLGGAVLVMTLSVFGVGLKTPIADLELNARPYMNTSVITLLVTGILLGISESVKLGDREAFLVKMIGLTLAILFTYLVFNPMVRRGDTGPAVRATAGATIAVWLITAIAGRWIGFS